MLRMGFFEKSWTQPAWAQLIRWNFFASRRCAIIGATFSWTYASSASDSKKNGMANTLNASSISARPAGGERRSLQAVDGHPGNRGRLARNRARVNSQPDAGSGGLRPRGPHAAQRARPGRALRCKRREPDVQRRLSDADERNRRRHGQASHEPG